jgi:RNA polymerase sigma-70 factor (ECF subfamily)
MSDAEEVQLVKQIRSGDSAAMAKFLDLKREAVTGYIHGQLGTGLRKKVEAEDIFQEVAMEAIKRVDQSFDNPFTWLCRISDQKIVDAYRKYFGASKRDARREVSADGDERGIANMLIASMTSPSAVFSKDQKHLKMLQALEELPEDHRDALRLRYFEGLGSKEIADRLGKSNGAVRVMLSRSLSKLQELLGPDVAPR